jgi:RNA polymerase sigma-70 factor (ECF subfamily)
VDRDFELLTQWRDGDKTAGNDLFQRHFESVRRFFRNKVDLKDAEDLIQRTFLACVEAVPKFRGDSSFRTYLFTIARRELCHYIRRKTRDAARNEPDLTVTSIMDLGISPSVAAVVEQERAIIAEAMRRIPVDFQITLELYYWEQLKGPELAEVLGIAPATVRTRLHRAREALREMLQKLRAGDVAVSDEDLESSVHVLRDEL